METIQLYHCCSALFPGWHSLSWDRRLCKQEGSCSGGLLTPELSFLTQKPFLWVPTAPGAVPLLLLSLLPAEVVLSWTQLNSGSSCTPGLESPPGGTLHKHSNVVWIFFIAQSFIAQILTNVGHLMSLD